MCFQVRVLLFWEQRGLEGPQPPTFGRLVAPKDAAMVAYAQLEVLAYLPSLQVGARSHGCVGDQRVLSA